MHYSRIAKGKGLATYNANAQHHLQGNIYLLQIRLAPTAANPFSGRPGETSLTNFNADALMPPAGKLYLSGMVAFSEVPANSAAMVHFAILVGEGVPCDGSYGRSKSVKIHGHRCISMVLWGVCNKACTVRLEGWGKVVQIDESLFRHKPKV